MHKGHINGMSDNFHQFWFRTVFLRRPYLHIWIIIQSTDAVKKALEMGSFAEICQGKGGGEKCFRTWQI